MTKEIKGVKALKEGKVVSVNGKPCTVIAIYEKAFKYRPAYAAATGSIIQMPFAGRVTTYEMPVEKILKFEDVKEGDTVILMRDYGDGEPVQCRVKIHSVGKWCEGYDAGHYLCEIHQKDFAKGLVTNSPPIGTFLFWR